MDTIGGILESLTIAADTGGHQQLLDWAGSFGQIIAFGIEGTGSYGVGLTSFIRRHGHRVIEINRPDRRMRRLVGKSDTLDAARAARAGFAGFATAEPKTADGTVEMIRQLKVATMAADHLREGIRVNCVSPGTADTPWVGRLLSAAEDPEAERAALELRQPSGRLVTAEEVAVAVVYLASPLAGATTGINLPVDGGLQGLRLRPIQ